MENGETRSPSNSPVKNSDFSVKKQIIHYLKGANTHTKLPVQIMRLTYPRPVFKLKRSNVQDNLANINDYDFTMVLIFYLFGIFKSPKNISKKFHVHSFQVNIFKIKITGSLLCQ